MKTHKFANALLVSILSHLGFGCYLLWKVESAHPVLIKETTVELSISDIQKQPDQPLKPIKVPEQLVETDPDLLPYDDDDPADFLGEKNQRVDVETVAEQIGQFKNDANAQGKSPGESDDLDPDLIPDTDDGLSAKSDSSNSTMPGGGSENLDFNSSNDNLKTKQLGLKTLLNTKEYIYFSYYKQIKTQISKYWEAQIKEKMFLLLQGNRDVASQRDPVTRLFIVIDRNGQLSGVQILGPSGTQELDQAAVDAFKQAAPFPVPPTGIVDSGGNVKIRWDFVLQARNQN